MFSSPYFRSALECSKRIKITSSRFRPLSTTTSPETPDKANPVTTKEEAPSSSESSEITSPKPERAAKAGDGPLGKTWQERSDRYIDKFRIPKNVQAVYNQPLRRKPKYGLPVCDLQLRSYSARHVEFFSDFALRAAYYLNLPASGPVPLPRLTERWTVPKSPFIYKKVQENFERITLRRLIQIKDGHPDTVQVWLSFLRKNAYHGVGMKANVWDHAPIGVGKAMDESAEAIEKALDSELANFGAKKGAKFPESISAMLERETQTRTNAPMTDVRKG